LIERSDKPEQADVINHPPWYDLNPQPIDVIEAWGLGYHEGTVLKYLSRWRRKGGLEDLKKSAWFLNRLIEQEEKHGTR